MIERWSIPGLQVLDVGGQTQFRSRLGATLANSRSRDISLSAIGVVRDADDDAQAAMASISDALRALDLPVPRVGEILHGPPAIGVFILPDCGSPGALEQLCWMAVSDTEAGRCSSGYVECLQGSAALHSRNIGKTLVHAYLAAQEEPAASVGVGALNDYWPLDHSAFTDIRGFLERLASV